MLFAILLWADDAKPAVEQTTPPWATFLPLIAIFIVFYFLMIRPAQKRERNAREMINNSLKKNVEIVTSGGIIGTVTHIKENGEEVTIRIDDTAKMRILRSSIVRILTPGEDEKITEK